MLSEQSNCHNYPWLVLRDQNRAQSQFLSFRQIQPLPRPTRDGSSQLLERLKISNFATYFNTSELYRTAANTSGISPSSGAQASTLAPAESKAITISELQSLEQRALISGVLRVSCRRPGLCLHQKQQHIYTVLLY